MDKQVNISAIAETRVDKWNKKAIWRAPIFQTPWIKEWGTIWTPQLFKAVVKGCEGVGTKFIGDVKQEF